MSGVGFTKYPPPETRLQYSGPYELIRKPKELPNVKFYDPFVGARGACCKSLIELLTEN